MENRGENELVTNTPEETGSKVNSPAGIPAGRSLLCIFTFAVSEALLYPPLRIPVLSGMTSGHTSFKNTKPVHVRRSYANVRDREAAPAQQ